VYNGTEMKTPTANLNTWAKPVASCGRHKANIYSGIISDFVVSVTHVQ
jgi:hypothetical protein